MGCFRPVWNICIHASWPEATCRPVLWIREGGRESIRITEHLSSFLTGLSLFGTALFNLGMALFLSVVNSQSRFDGQRSGAIKYGVTATPKAWEKLISTVHLQAVICKPPSGARDQLNSRNEQAERCSDEMLAHSNQRVLSSPLTAAYHYKCSTVAFPPFIKDKLSIAEVTELGSHSATPEFVAIYPLGQCVEKLGSVSKEAPSPDEH